MSALPISFSAPSVQAPGPSGVDARTVNFGGIGGDSANSETALKAIDFISASNKDTTNNTINKWLILTGVVLIGVLIWKRLG